MTTTAASTGTRRSLTRKELTRLRMALGRLGRVLRQQTDDDLPYALVSLLFNIERTEPVTAGDLAAAEGVPPPAITRSLNRLSELGLISREPHPGDGRASMIRLTAEGRAERRRILRSRDVWLSEYLRRLDAHELELLVAAMPVLERLCDPELSPAAW
jgi:DNA-binding MarR family transcriptional regulator